MMQVPSSSAQTGGVVGRLVADKQPLEGSRGGLVRQKLAQHLRIELAAAAASVG